MNETAALPVLLALLLLAGVAPAGAQEEAPREPPRMPQDSTPRDTTALDTTQAGTGMAQPFSLGYTPAVLSLGLAVARPGSGDAQTQRVQAVLTLPGLVRDSTVLTRTVALRGGWLAGLGTTVQVGPRWALHLAGRYGASTLRSALGDTGDFFAATPDAVPDATGEITLVTGELLLRYWIPSSRRVQPFAELGAGLTRWSGQGELPEARALSGGVNRWEAVAGVGIAVPLSRRFNAHVRATRRLFRTPFDVAPAGDTVASGELVVLTARDPAATSFADGAIEALGLTRLEVGFNVLFHRAPVAPVPPPSAPREPEKTVPPPPPGL